MQSLQIVYVLVIELFEILQKGDRYEHLKAAQDKHTYHIQKLETIMRMVDNDALPLEQVKHFIMLNQMQGQISSQIGITDAKQPI